MAETCARCHRPTTDGWADGDGGVICQDCLNLATGKGSVRDALVTIHALAHYGYDERDCPVCIENAEMVKR